MKIRLEKEVSWRNGQSITQYWIWADDRCIELAHTEEEAHQKYENVKSNYIVPSKETLKEEEV